MPSPVNDNPDVLIMGGGPAGSTMGTLLAGKGYQVVLLEKDNHPRFHIGESLLPMNMPILERLGVLPAVADIGVVKYGADFTSDGPNQEHRTYNFDRALASTLAPNTASAFEVKREEFDALLFDHCRQSGVCALQGQQVTELELIQHADAGARHRVTSVDEAGKSHQWNPRFVVDATGRDALLARSRHWNRRNHKHASAAMFGHFRSVERRPGLAEGNISIYWQEHGWIWMIPLRDDVMSVGAVCWPDYLKTRRGLSADEFLQRTLALSPSAAARMGHAEPISTVQVTGNYSYHADRLGGPGFLLIGDAYAFVDPVFSSGVYLAMNSAEQGAPLVDLWLQGRTAAYRRGLGKYARRIKRGLRSFCWFIYRFTSPAMRNLLDNPRNTFKVEQAVISMLAGDVFNNSEVRRRLWIFKAIYGISFALTFASSLAARRRRLRNASSEVAVEYEKGN